MPLIDNLVSYWPLDEASGNALDAHGSNDLAETSGTIASATGKLGNCRDIEAADTECFEHATNTDFSPGDAALTFTGWFQTESSGITQHIIGKFNTGGNRSYRLLLNTSDIPTLIVSGNGTATTTINSAFGAVTAGVWYFFRWWHDPVLDTINLQINDETPDSAAHSTGLFDGSGPFHIGSQGQAAGSPSNPFDGLLDDIGMWHRVLTSDEHAELYNAGAGLAYPFDGGGGGWIPPRQFGRAFNRAFTRAV